MRVRTNNMNIIFDLSILATKYIKHPHDVPSVSARCSFALLLSKLPSHTEELNHTTLLMLVIAPLWAANAINI